MVDVLRTHPLVIIGGILQENPFFVPPDEFLRELRERQADRYEDSRAKGKGVREIAMSLTWNGHWRISQV